MTSDEKLDLMRRYALIEIECQLHEDLLVLGGPTRRVMAGEWWAHVTYCFETKTGVSEQEAKYSAMTFRDLIDQAWSEFCDLYPAVVELADTLLSKSSARA